MALLQFGHLVESVMYIYVHVYLYVVLCLVVSNYFLQADPNEKFNPLMPTVAIWMCHTRLFRQP